MRSWGESFYCQEGHASFFFNFFFLKATSELRKLVLETRGGKTGIQGEKGMNPRPEITSRMHESSAGVVTHRTETRLQRELCKQGLVFHLSSLH